MDIWQKIANGDYKNKYEYPLNHNWITCDCGQNHRKSDIEKHQQFCFKCAADIRIILKTKQDEYRKARLLYDNEELRLHELFKQDVRQEFCNSIFFKQHLSDKQFNLMFSKAWEQGHANGLSEVVSEFSDLLDFWKEMNGK